MPNAKPSVRGTGPGMPLPDGHAQVEFDAGGQASFVNPNPVRPILETKAGKEFLVVRWNLEKTPLHANSGFEVVFGNIVPCYQGDFYLEGLVSKHDRFRKVWTWTWPKPDQLPSLEEGALLFYDVFFSYQPAPLLQSARGREIKRPHHVQTVSLRQIMSTDPTIILPPKEGGG